ncbi:kinase-like protein [Venturia nashicola]|uniref:EKC/KEOPS complex subunit BUD32 n=1 Tax=Venturia nashicola TaxID=86259 RepID=A0A4Z1P0R0_9PEZI|nr:kinase-like protein [Venturia nashicola]TLD15078.1 kinase-like protein [Venturia nashicola]
MAATTTHFPPAPFSSSLPHELSLITQGAEALIYKTHLLNPTTTVALKYRPKKSYRHPALDAKLTRGRILAEARVMMRLRKEGVGVPAIMGMSWEEGWLGMEWINGGCVRAVLDWWFRAQEVEGKSKDEGNEVVLVLMRKIGRVVGKMHEVGVTHGDLTTSNLMVKMPTSSLGGGVEIEAPVVPDSSPLNNSPIIERESQHTPQLFDPAILQGQIMLIDFGLAVQTVQDEDRAVDLYVLERAFGSTHPQAGDLFLEVLKAYSRSFEGASIVLKRLEDVRLRGRKKSMIG